MTHQGKKYISLKEAAELSGYTPDYVGQLIRKGKLPGKKVYANVAWMTTAEDLEAYMEAVKNGYAVGNGEKTKRTLQSQEGGGWTKPALYFVAGFLGAAVFALFYILAVNVDSRLEEQAVEGSAVDAIDIEMPEGGYQSL